jgi:hypothetical protein
MLAGEKTRTGEKVDGEEGRWHSRCFMNAKELAKYR